MKDLKCEEKNVVDLVGKTRKKERGESGRLKERGRVKRQRNEKERERGRQKQGVRGGDRKRKREGEKTDREKETGKMCVCKYCV